MRLRIVLAVFLCAFSLFALNHHALLRWSIDGYTYAVMAQVDAGIPYAAARDASRAFYLRTDKGRHPNARRVLANDVPQWSRVFAARPVYPALAAMLWKTRGFESLVLVSNVAFVVSVLLTYLLALRFANPYAAAAGAALLAASPLARVLGNDALTDETALAFWTATLVAACVFVRTTGMRATYSLVVIAVLLAATRPVFYAIGSCACALAVVRPRRAAFVACVALLAAVVPVTIALYARANIPVAHPYFPMLVSALQKFAAELVCAWWVVCGILGLATIRNTDERMLLWGGAAACFVSIALSSATNDVARVAVLPLLPVAACGMAALISSTVERIGVRAVTAS